MRVIKMKRRFICVCCSIILLSLLLVSCISDKDNVGDTKDTTGDTTVDESILETEFSEPPAEAMTEHKEGPNTDFVGNNGDFLRSFYGENTGIKPIVEFSDIEKIVSSYAEGAVNENGDNLLNDDGTVVDGDFYFVNFEIDGSSVETEVEKRTFMVKDLTAGIASIGSKIAPCCEITDTEVTPSSFLVKAKVNRITDKIEYIEIQRNYIVKANYNFIDKLAAFGEKQIEFSYTVAQKFDYFYAGVDILEGQIIIDENGEGVLTVNADIEDYSDYTVRFISSDESIATVDEMGYVTGVKASKTPVTITVELEYLGRIFTDQCTVVVGDTDSVEEVAQ